MARTREWTVKQAMFCERVSPLSLLCRAEGRAALAGTVLALLQAAGLVISLYMLVANLLVEEGATDPSTHVCTEALLCLLFRYGPLYYQTGDTSLALSGQLLYSLLATGANLSLVVGALGRRPLAILPWLLLYGLAVLGALALALLLPLTVVFRDRDLGDNSLADTAWLLVPLLLCLAYTVLWVMVAQLFLQLYRLQARPYSLEP